MILTWSSSALISWFTSSSCSLSSSVLKNIVVLTHNTHFQCYVQNGYLSTSSFDVPFEMSQWQLMHAGVCFMSLLCKLVTSSKCHASAGLWLVDFNLSWLLSMLKDGWQKISTNMYRTLKVGIIIIVFYWFENFKVSLLWASKLVQVFCQLYQKQTKESGDQTSLLQNFKLHSRKKKFVVVYARHYSKPALIRKQNILHV